MSPRDGTWRRERLARARLYLCAPATRPAASSLDLEAFLDQVLAGGVDVVQLRDKEAEPATVREGARVFRAAADRHGALFVLNDDPSLAVAAGADGVHVGQDDGSVASARAVVGPELLVGRSTHGREQIDAALATDADYLGVGPVHATPTKQGRDPIGLEPVRHAAAVADRPFYVTGGMGLGTIDEVIAAGAHGVVVVRALTGSADPHATAASLAARWSDGDWHN